MSEYDHIAAALIVLIGIGWLIWRALDCRIYGADPQAKPHGDWPHEWRRK